MGTSRNGNGVSGRGAVYGASVGGLVALAIAAWAIARGVATQDDIASLRSSMNAQSAMTREETNRKFKEMSGLFVDRIVSERALTDSKVRANERDITRCESAIDRLEKRFK